MAVQRYQKTLGAALTSPKLTTLSDCSISTTAKTSTAKRQRTTVWERAFINCRGKNIPTTKWAKDWDKWSQKKRGSEVGGKRSMFGSQNGMKCQLSGCYEVSKVKDRPCEGLAKVEIHVLGPDGGKTNRPAFLEGNATIGKCTHLWLTDWDSILTKQWSEKVSFAFYKSYSGNKHKVRRYGERRNEVEWVTWKKLKRKTPVHSL